MKKRIMFSLLLQALIFLSISAQVLQTSFTNEEGWSTQSYDNWEKTIADKLWKGNSINISSSNKKDIGYGIGFNDVGDWLELPEVNNPGVLSFYASLSSNGGETKNMLAVQIFDSGEWSTLEEISQSVNSFEQFTIEINKNQQGVRLRILRTADQRSHYIDELTLTSMDNIPDKPERIHSSIIKMQNHVPVLTGDTLQSEITGKFQLNLFSIQIEDTGDDDKDTYPRQLYFSAGPNNNIDFSQSLTNLQLEYEGKSIDMDIIEQTKSSVLVTLPDSGQEIIVPNGQSISFDVIANLYLPSYSDSDTLQMQIPGAGHKCLTDTAGTGFADTFSEFPMISDAYRFNISATTIRFSKIPDAVIINQPFSVELLATNDKDQTDFDFDGEVSLQVESGNGTLLLPVSDSLIFSNGKCVLNELAYDKTGNFTLFAQTAQFSSGQSEIIHSVGEQATEIEIIEQTQDTIKRTSRELTNKNSIDVIRLKIKESTSSDKLPTVIQQVELQYDHFNAAKEALLPPIQSLYFYTNDDSMWATDIEFESSKMIAEFENALFKVNNGDSIEVTLGIMVQPESIVDRGILTFRVPKETHNWKSIENSSQFYTEFSAELQSPPILFEVLADSLILSGNDLLLQKGEPGYFQCMATDRNDNKDVDFTGSSTITQIFGKNNAEVQKTLAFSEGISTVIKPVFNTSGQYILQVNADNDIQGQTDTIYVADTLTTLIHANFETNDLQNWEGFSEWKTSGFSPLTGDYSLKHALISQAGNSLAFYNFDSIDGDTAMLLWAFTLQTTDWEPSSSNNFRVWLSNIVPESKNEHIQGYAIEFYDGELVFSQKSSTGSSTRLIYSGRKIEQNEVLRCQVLRLPGGYWKVYFNQPQKNTEHVFYRLAGSAIDNQFSKFQTSGIQFIYTKTRAGKLRIDDYSIVAAPGPVRIIHAEQKNDSLIDITFSDELIGMPEHFQLFKIDNEIQTEQNVKIIPELNNNTSVLHLTIPDIKEGSYNIKCSGVTGIHTGRREQTQINVVIEEMKTDSVIPEPNDSTFTSNIQMNDIIFTEIMFDPSPPVSLPDIEYIEIYNSTDSVLSLMGTYLMAGDKKVRLPFRVIEPGQYLVICDEDAKPIFTKFTDALTIPSFPSLLNSGAVLQLRDTLGQLITAVHYDVSFHNAQHKKDGGWSIERISIYSELATKANWQSSKSLVGGTPGKENSVANSEKDTFAPEIAQYDVKNNSTLVVQFSEPIMNKSFEENIVFSITNGNTISSIQRDSIFNDKIEINFQAHFIQGEKYTLSLQGLQDWAGNGMQQATIDIFLPYPAHEGDIIINEVLFNPVSNGVEFVELYNISDNSFDLSTVSISNDNNFGQFLKTVRITENPSLFESKSYVVLTESCDELWNNHPNTIIENCIEVSKFPRLNDKEGSILLLNNASELIDQFTYNDNMHYQLLTDVKGVSLERINPQMPTHDESNWHSASYLASYATPGFQNSQFMNNTAPNDYFKLEPEVFSPDNDGYHDLLFVSYKMDMPGYSALVRIYNPKGRLVKELLSNQLLETEGNISWDGFNENNVKSAPGIYIVYIQLYTPQGTSKEFKKTCVLAKRF